MQGMPTVRVDDLIIHPRERDLIAGTHGATSGSSTTSRRSRPLTTPRCRPTRICSTSAATARLTDIQKQITVGGAKHFRGQNPDACGNQLLAEGERRGRARQHLGHHRTRGPGDRSAEGPACTACAGICVRLPRAAASPLAAAPARPRNRPRRRRRCSRQRRTRRRIRLRQASRARAERIGRRPLAPPAGRGGQPAAAQPAPPHRRLLRRKVAAVVAADAAGSAGATRRQLSGQGHRRRQGDRDEDCRDRSGFTTVGSFSASLQPWAGDLRRRNEAGCGGRDLRPEGWNCRTISVPTTLPHPSPAFAISKSAPPIDFLPRRIQTPARIEMR